MRWRARETEFFADLSDSVDSRLDPCQFESDSIRIILHV